MRHTSNTEKNVPVHNYALYDYVIYVRIYITKPSACGTYLSGVSGILMWYLSCVSSFFMWYLSGVGSSDVVSFRCVGHPNVVSFMCVELFDVVSFRCVGPPDDYLSHRRRRLRPRQGLCRALLLLLSQGKE